MKQTCRIVYEEYGFTIIKDSRRMPLVTWSEILEIFVYKADLFATDEICLGIRVHEDGTSLMVSEESPGFQELLAELTRRFPGICTDWFTEVAFPAFAPNRTTLWGQTSKPNFIPPPRTWS